MCNGSDSDCSDSDEEEVIDDFEEEFNGVAEADLEAALRYYNIYRKMYLLAESDGPWMITNNGTEPNDLYQFHYTFNKEFVL